jgi:uncharacterized protein YceH (UPF0502 family)
MRDKRDRFVGLAEKRVNKAIKDIRLIGNLSNRNNYEYEDSEAQAILRVLEQEVKALRSRFEQSSKKSHHFKL